MKTSTYLNELERKYIVAALIDFRNKHYRAFYERIEVTIANRLIKKINSGIRYDRPLIAQELGKNK